MAGAIVSYVLGKIGDVAYQEALLLYGTGDAVEWAKRQLEWLSAFLEDADAKQNKDARVKQWVKDVKEVAYMIEDALDKFLVEVGGGSRMGLLERARKIPKVLLARHKIGTEIDSIKKRVTEIKENKESYGITAIENSSTGHVRQLGRIPIIPEIDQQEVVGFKDDINNIRDLLLDENNLRRTVISIVAPGGCGKTTVAKKVYNSDEVKRHFNDELMWLTISQTWTMFDVLIRMLENLKVEVTAEMRQKSEEYLIIKIHNSLSTKKYLVVFDDVWSIDFWTKLKVALPEDNNGSRVLITTRLLTVAEKAESMKKPYKLRFLDEYESKQLLLKVVFPNCYVAECPDILLPLATQFAKKCNGLPLAVLVLGGFLSTKPPDYDTWYEIISKMNWSTEGAECMDIVSTSYDDLPRHLKLCFLYFASFPEDYEIRVSRLVRMWIAEGFIQPETTKSLEDTAMNYLEQLVQRCMVQISTMSNRKIGKIKFCRIHDILHALASHKAEEDSFLMVWTKSRADSNSGIQTPIPIPIRRVAFPEFGDGDTQPVEVLGPYLRSLMCYGKSLPNCNKLEMARVLSLEYRSSGSDNADDNDLKWKWLKQLTSLRYLRIENSGRLEHANLSYLAQLKYLQTLEIDGVKHRAPNRNACRSTSSCLSYVSNLNENRKNKKNKKDENNEDNDADQGENEELLQLPDSFWDNKMLRRVIFPLSSVVGPPSFANLENLVDLRGVHAREEWGSVKLPHFPRIRKLVITLDANFNWEAMANSLVQQAEHLTFLTVDLRDPHKVADNVNYVIPAFRNCKQLRYLILPLIQKVNFDPASESFFEPIISLSAMLPPNLVQLGYLTWSSHVQFEGDHRPKPSQTVTEKIEKNLPHLESIIIYYYGPGGIDIRTVEFDCPAYTNNFGCPIE